MLKYWGDKILLVKIKEKLHQNLINIFHYAPLWGDRYVNQKYYVCIKLTLSD